MRLALVAFIALSAFGQDAPAPASGPAPVKDLRAFYRMSCAGCHGADGSAMRDGKKLKGQDFTDKKDMDGKKDADLVKAIQNGLFFGKRMPAYKERISEADSLRLVQEVLRKAEKGKVIQGEEKQD